MVTRRSMVTFVGTACLALGAAVFGAGDAPAKPVPALAQPAMKKFNAAVALADADRAKVVNKAKGELITNLKSAQKMALERNDVEAATACAELAKQYDHDDAQAAPPASATPKPYVGTSWEMDGTTKVRLNADWTVTHSNPQYTGRWSVIGDRTVMIVWHNSNADVWKFDEAGKTFKAVAYQKSRDYDGKAAGR